MKENDGYGKGIDKSILALDQLILLLKSLRYKLKGSI
jgi:hypothetical protein